MPPRVDLVGRSFERLVAVAFVGNDSNGKARWLCRCACGAEKVVLSNSLLKGATRSCGCLRRELARRNGCRSRGPVSHGLSGTPEYAVWKTMVQRCTNPKSEDWSLYGGRGVTLC